MKEITMVSEYGNMLKKVMSNEEKEKLLNKKWTVLNAENSSTVTKKVKDIEISNNGEKTEPKTPATKKGNTKKVVKKNG